jgi:hypothetical protein
VRRSTRKVIKSGSNKLCSHQYFIWVSIIALVLLIGIACNLPSGLNTVSQESMTLDQALAVPPRDDRPEILGQMGQPDAFRITFETLNSSRVRYEEWSYFDDQTRLDFMDGTLVATVQLDPLPDGSIFASDFDPQSFQAKMSVEDVKALFPDQQLLEVDATQVGVPGGLVMAGQRILIGFDQGQLVYVETLALTPQVNP